MRTAAMRCIYPADHLPCPGVSGLVHGFHAISDICWLHGHAVQQNVTDTEPRMSLRTGTMLVNKLAVLKI